MGLLDSLIGNSTPSYNVTPGMNQVNANKTANTGIVNNTFNKLGTLNQPYQQSTTAIGQGYADKANTLGQTYLNNVGSAGDQLGTSLSQALTRNTMAAQPALQNSLREQLAGTGGLERGAYDQGVLQLGQQAANNIYEGNQNIANQQLANRTAALGTVYGNQNNLNNTLLGNDVGANSQVYGNNRTDLGNQSAQLQDINNNANNDILSLLGTQQNSNIAAQSASNGQNSALLAALLGAAGTVGGAAIGGPVGAAAAGQGVRGSVQQVNPSFNFA